MEVTIFGPTCEDTDATNGIRSIGLALAFALIRFDDFLHGLFDLRKAGRFASQAVGWIG